MHNLCYSRIPGGENQNLIIIVFVSELIHILKRKHGMLKRSVAEAVKESVEVKEQAVVVVEVEVEKETFNASTSP